MRSGQDEELFVNRAGRGQPTYTKGGVVGLVWTVLAIIGLIVVLQYIF